MKILVIVCRDNHSQTIPQWLALGKEFEVTIKNIESFKKGRPNKELINELIQLRNHSFERVIYDGNIRRLGKCFSLLKGIPNLVLHDHDICNDFCKESPYYKLFTPLLKSLDSHRLITSNFEIYKSFTKKGLCVSYLPKSYNSNNINYLKIEKDIEFGFIGRTDSKIYKNRLTLLKKIKKHIDLKIIRTTNSNYNITLNRIKYFISADAFFNEFMIKNFEAMAANCVLFALFTCQEEIDFLQFKHMKNIIFYESVADLINKINYLQENPKIAFSIAKAGRLLVQSQHKASDRGDLLEKILMQPIGNHPKMTFIEKLYFFKLKIRNFLSF